MEELPKKKKNIAPVEQPKPVVERPAKKKKVTHEPPARKVIEDDPANETYREKALRLERKLLEKKSKIVWQKRQLQLLSNKEKEFLNWEKEKKEIRREVAMLREENTRLEKENENLLQNNRVHLSAQLGLAESEVMQEKSRILMNMLWVNRNTQNNRCEIVVNEDDQYQTKQKIESFITHTKAVLGEDKIFFDTSTNAVKFHLPGLIVRGMSPSNIDSASSSLLSEISESMIDLPIKNISIQGYHPNASIRSGDRVIDSSLFMLNQANKIRDYFIKDEGWSSRIISASALSSGHRSTSSYGEKHFKVKVEFNQRGNPGRGLASLNTTSINEKAHNYKDIFSSLTNNLFTQLQ